MNETFKIKSFSTYYDRNQIFETDFSKNEALKWLKQLKFWSKDLKQRSFWTKRIRVAYFFYRIDSLIWYFFKNSSIEHTIHAIRLLFNSRKDIGKLIFSQVASKWLSRMQKKIEFNIEKLYFERWIVIAPEARLNSMDAALDNRSILR